MLSRRKYIFAFTPLLLAQSATAADDFDAGLQVETSFCKGSNHTSYNATGSESGVTASSGNGRWEIMTGLFTNNDPKASAEQIFWITSTDSIDLNNGIDYTGAWRLFYALPDEMEKKVREDSEQTTCEETIGKACLDKLSTGGADNDTTPQTIFSDSTSLPDECKFLGDDLMENSVEGPITPVVSHGSNTTCPSTVDNANGQQSALLSISRNSSSDSPDFSIYDQMARKAYLMQFVVWTVSENIDTCNGTENCYPGDGWSTTTSNSFVCLYNKDFAEGSRVPEDLQEHDDAPQPSPSNKPSAASALSTNKWFWALTLGAFVLFG